MLSAHDLISSVLGDESPSPTSTPRTVEQSEEEKGPGADASPSHNTSVDDDDAISLLKQEEVIVTPLCVRRIAQMFIHHQQIYARMQTCIHTLMDTYTHALTHTNEHIRTHAHIMQPHE